MTNHLQLGVNYTLMFLYKDTAGANNGGSSNNNFDAVDGEYAVSREFQRHTLRSYAIYVLIGKFVVGDSKSPYLIAAATVGGAVQFFLITNFCEWLRLPELYARDFSGLLASYVAALPFCLNSLAGDAIFTPLAFGVHALLTRELSTKRSLA